MANRVSEIQRYIGVEEWHHVNTRDNSADLISQGMPLDQLMGSSIWWTGPSWLQGDSMKWPIISNEADLTLLPEQRKITI